MPAEPRLAPASAPAATALHQPERPEGLREVVNHFRKPVTSQCDPSLVVSPRSLFACPAADVTPDRVRELMSQNLPESLTLEYKESFSPNLVTSVAAMANSYGGLILVGVTDGAADERILGVPETEISRIVNACHDRLEPPWEPEIIPVPIGSDLWVVIVRIDPGRAPRPILLDGRAPVRLQGRNATADRARLAELFTQTPAGQGGSAWRIMSPQLPRRDDGSDAVDFAVNSGLVVPLGERATHRPISDRSASTLADALNNSPLARRLLKWADNLGRGGLNPFSS